MKQPANYHIEKIYAIRLCTATVLSVMSLAATVILQSHQRKAQKDVQLD